MAKQNTPKSLSEMLDERNTYITKRLSNASELAYTSNDLGYITRFETAVESFLDSVQMKSSSGPSENNRPTLNPELYKQALKQGMTNEEIKKNYKLKSKGQLAVLGRWHGKSKTQKSKKKVDNRKKVLQKSRSILSWDKYVDERDSGTSHQEMKEKYDQVDSIYLRSLAGTYKRQKNDGKI